MTSRLTATYLLVDGVLMPNAFNALRSAGGVEDLLPLYVGTPWAELRELGPLLVKLAPDADVLRQVLACTHDWSARTSLLCSHAFPHEVARHMRRLIAPPDVHGGRGLLRLADPLIARHWLGSYEQCSLNTLLGPIEAWHLVVSTHSWLPAVAPHWQSFECTAPGVAWTDASALLGQEQLNALNLAGRWQLMERLYAALARHPARLLARHERKNFTSWLEARLDEALSWGVSSDRGVALWVEYSLRWGEGFTQHLNGPYQRWLGRTADALKLAPELRIQRMDNDCLQIELDKDAQ